MHIDQVMSILDEIAGRYPEDIFPANGESLDCASARFARNIVQQIREKVQALQPKRIVHATPSELAARFNLSASGLWRRLHHPKCPVTDRYETPSGKLMSLEVSADLEEFLALPKLPGRMTKL